MAKFTRDTLRLISMMRRGQLIVSGGGITVRQLPTGQYELRMEARDLEANARRTNPETSNPLLDSGGNKPGKPILPVRFPVPPPVPPSPLVEIGSGVEVAGPAAGGNRVIGNPSRPAAPDPPYDFNQLGWQYYIINF